MILSHHRVPGVRDTVVGLSQGTRIFPRILRQSVNPLEIQVTFPTHGSLLSPTPSYFRLPSFPPSFAPSLTFFLPPIIIISDNQLILSKHSNMSKLREFRGHTSRVLHLAKSPDGDMIVSASADETLRFWNIFGSSTSSISGTYINPSLISQSNIDAPSLILTRTILLTGTFPDPPPPLSQVRIPVKYPSQILTRTV